MRIGLIILVAAILIAQIRTADAQSNSWAKLEPVAPFASLQAAAQSNGIPLDGFDARKPTNILSPGDAVSALVTLFEKKHQRTQWLIEVKVIEPTNAPSAKPAKPPKPMVLYTSTGNKFEFASSNATLTTRILGPFSDSETKRSKAKDENAEVEVSADYLGLGLDEGVDLIHRLHAESKGHATNEEWILSLDMAHPFPANVISDNQKLAAMYHVTKEQERAIAGTLPAMISYFTTVEETPDLKDILLKVVKLPSAWSIVRHLGVSVGFGVDKENVGPLALRDWKMPDGSKTYAMPWTIDLNDDPALRLSLLVTSPHPPLLTCGGIIGMLAENPADPENYLTVRVISAHCADSKAK